jgi:hypothetical protein
LNSSRMSNKISICPSVCPRMGDRGYFIVTENTASAA